MIATDGCLIASAKLVVVTAKDRKFLEQLQQALGGCGYIRKKVSGFGAVGYDLVIKRSALYDQLFALGITPRKSHTLGPLQVPGYWFREFLRGVIDGDGNIRRWQHPTNGREQWAVRIYGASEPFIRWLQATVERLWSVRGFVYSQQPKDERRHTLYTLKYGKLAARVILAKCYVPGSLALERKRVLAVACIGGSVGWSKSKTVLDRKLWKAWRYEHVWENRVTDLTNPNVDPTSGLVKEPDGLWAGVSELADDRRLKRLARKGVWVRIPPPAFVQMNCHVRVRCNA